MRPCTKCGVLFEPTAGQAKKHWWYCSACKREKWAAETVRKRSHPEIYKQSKNAPGYRQRPEVKECERQRARLAWHKPAQQQKHRDYRLRPEVKERERLRHHIQRYDPHHRPRILARELARKAVKTGRLTSMPCRNCGDPFAQIHHPNYDEPLNVIWLCSSCHIAEHKRLSRASL